MNEIISMLYLWLKSAHIIFVIFWMAGLFMMPRFFVYHQETAVGSEEDGKWIEREGKLRKIILNPSLVITLSIKMCYEYDHSTCHMRLSYIVHRQSCTTLLSLCIVNCPD